jgi:flagellar hook protein FlgE
MGILGAMQTAVSGMQAQAYALDNISGNIANSQTIGFKRIDTSFQDLVPDLALSTRLTGGVSAISQTTNAVAGARKTPMRRELFHSALHHSSQDVAISALM